MASAERLIEVFNEARARPPGIEREQFLAEACRDNLHLKQQVVSLLEAETEEDRTDFLRNTLIVRPDRVTEQPGDRIGRYKLLQQLGEGGCGVVYMAEQEEPVRRRVALKVIKLGMDTKSVIARFEAERQALALMDHPNIAKVFDAGATDAGRPFFVMELVRGIRITDYCDQNNLSTEQRLQLFTQVCHAVQHAHQKGIIHRDLKPSNILVTLHDGMPVPKVIDFGVAKATSDQRLTDKTVFTAFEQFIGTPAYMSPEQAEMSGLDIDTRSDIYSLGVLLYELLTGRTPLDPDELLRSGMNEMRRRIREEEPLRPSTRLSTMQAGDLSSIAKHRQADALKLIHLLRGDLDWIVMKCLEKDRARRYETANGLAMDLKRHLNNEPVIARPPSRAYKFQKLVRRNKLAFAAASAVMAALVLGLGISTWMFFRAQGEKKKAQTEAAKAMAVSDFLQQLLNSANPYELKGSEYTVRQLLDDFSAGLGTRLAGQPEVEATVRATIANSYLQLGLADKAEPHFARALALRTRIFGEQSQEVAQSLVERAWSLGEQSRQAEAEAEIRRALDIYRRNGGDAQRIIHASYALAVVMNLQQRLKEAETISEQALALARKSPNRDFPDTANLLHSLARTKASQAKYVEAENLALQATEMHRRLRGAGHPETAWSLMILGQALAGQHRLVEAERAYQEALAIFRRYHPFEHKTVQSAVLGLRAVLEAKGDSAAVEALYREGLAGQRAALGHDSPAVAETLSNLAASLSTQGKQAEAEKASREAMEIVLKLRNQDLARLPPILRRLTEALKSQGKSRDAERLYEEAIPVVRQTLGESHSALGELLFDFGTLLASENKWEASAEYHLKSLPIRRAHQDDNLAWTLRNLGGELVTIGRPQEAESYLRESLALYRKLHQQEDFNGTAWPSEKLGEALHLQHKLPEAEQTYRDAVASYSKCHALGSADCARAVRALLDVLKAEHKLADAEALCREILAQQRAALGDDSPAVANSLHQLGDVLRDSGRLKDSEEAFREAVARRRELFGTENLDLAHSLHGLAWVLNQNGKRAEAEALSREELAMRRKLLSDGHPDVASTRRDLETYLVAQGKLAEAEGMCRESLATAKKQFGDVHRTVDEALVSLAQVLQQRGKLAEAEAVQREELALERKLSGDEHPFVANSLVGLASVLEDQGKLSEAQTTYREALAMRRKLLGNEDPAVASALASLTMTLLAEKKFTEAEPVARECLGIREKKLPDAWQMFNTRSMLGGSLLGQKKYGEAEPLLVSGYEGLKQREKKIPAAGKVRLKEALQSLVQLYQATGQSEKAAEWNRELTEFDQAEATKKAADPKP